MSIVILKGKIDPRPNSASLAHDDSIQVYNYYKFSVTFFRKLLWGPGNSIFSAAVLESKKITPFALALTKVWNYL